MSRNVKYHTPTKAPRRVSVSSRSSLSEDDDHGYSGVEDVSDSDEDDEEHVFAAEEEHIRNSRKRAPPRPPPESEDDADEEAEDDEDNWNGILSEESADEGVEDLGVHTEQPDFDAHSDFIFETETQERHVRFTGVPDSDSDSTTSETSEDVRGLWPDLFVDQASLDPRFRREIENDDDGSSNSGSFWDYHSSQDLAPVNDDSDTPVATPMPAPEAATPVPAELDGYETDGDTTEEDIPEPPRRKARRHHVDAGSDSDTEQPTPFRRGKPRVGRFNLDKSQNKPIAVLNPSTKKMMIFTPQRLSRLDLSPESFNLELAPDCSPILSNPGYVMLGAMLSSNTFGDFINTQPYGPAEAFFPVGSGLPLDLTDDSDYAHEPDEEESKLNLNDFLKFNQGSSDEEEEEEAEWNPESSPTRPQTAASGVSGADEAANNGEHPLFTHFDNNSGVVGAFRRNQINQQLIYSEKASSESLAFSTPYHYGTLRGIKSGSMETVTTPITPARRHKRNASHVDPQGSPQQKRKASGGLAENMHKKQRSISDMDLLQL